MLKKLFSRPTAPETPDAAAPASANGARRRVMVIGLDCAEPELVFDRWLNDLPNIKSLYENGLHGPLRSCDPPITVPAWSVMMSSKSPGRLGVYGFRNRADHSYDRYSIANSLAIKEDRLWEILSQKGKRSIVIGVPGTYPPKPLNGTMVTDFLTPDISCEYTHPPELKQEIQRVVGEYILDVRDFRSGNKKKILADIYEMTRKRFQLARHLLARDDWDYFIMVEMGTDRIHHALWDNMDPAHRFYEAGNKFESAIHDYYVEVDREIGELLKFADASTDVLVVSDHGAKRMDGGICVNEWLMANGYLALKEQPTNAVPLSKVKIDWSRTKAWGDGGYYARVFLNVAGREPEGTIPPDEYEVVRADLAARIAAIPDDAGDPIPTAVYKPEELYGDPQGVAPDLIVVFGDLLWRSVGTIGGDEGIQTLENDTGPDDANHAQDGLYVMAGSGIGATGRNDAHLLDIAPTVLELLDIEEPGGMRGASLLAAGR